MREYSEYSKQDFEQAKQYWLDKLSGEIEGVQLTGNLIPSKENQRGIYSFRFSRELTQKLFNLSKDQDILLFIILISTFTVFVNRFNGQKDMIIGSPIYSSTGEFYDFNRMLPFRNTIIEGMPFKELLSQVKQTVINGYRYQYFSMETLLELLKINKEEKPLYKVILLLENIHNTNHIREILNSPGMDMAIFFAKEGEEIQAKIEYNTLDFSEPAVRKISDYYTRVLEQVFQNINAKIESIQLFTEEEKKQLIIDFNDTKADMPPQRNIQGLFEDQVEKFPKREAVISDIDLTDVYEELKPENHRLQLIKKLQKCCFRKNKFLLHLEEKTFLKAIDVFNQEELEDIQLYWTNKNRPWMGKFNYVAMNNSLSCLLNYIDGHRNIGTLYESLKKEKPTIRVCLFESIDSEGFLKIEKREFVIGDDIKDFLRVIKILFNMNVLDLVAYNPGESRINIPLKQDVEKLKSFTDTSKGSPPGGLGDQAVHPASPDKLPGKKTATKIKSPVLLLGDTVGTASSGLVYLTSYLRRKGIEAFCQWNNLNQTQQSVQQNIETLLSKVKPKLVGISMKWFPHMARVLEMCRIIKKYDPSIEIVVGGNSASFYWEEIIKNECIDYVVKGDGELPLAMICLGEKEVPNCAYKKDGKVISTSLSYVQDEKNSENIYFSHFEEIFVSKRDPYLTYPLFINIGKGCPFPCFFCGGCREAQKKTFNRPNAFLRRVEDVRKDIRFVRDYITTYMFDSDIMSGQAYGYFNQVFEGMEFPEKYCAFYCNILPTSELIELLCRKFKYVYLNVDMVSFSEPHRLKLNQLKVVKPQPTDEEIYSFFDECEKYTNVEVGINLITGVPFYTAEDIPRSDQLFTKLYVTYSCFKDVAWGRLHAQPGAPLNNTCQEYDMYSYADGFNDFLYYSEMNLKEKIYPGMDNLQYPYIYFNDDTLNSKITRFYAETSNKISMKFQYIRNQLRVPIRVNYQELNQMANQLARRLQKRGIARSHIVGIMMENSIKMVGAILAVLKSGGAYCPIDPDYPMERKKYMLRDSLCNELIIQTHLLAKNQEIIQEETLKGILEIDKEDTSSERLENLQIPVNGKDLAYVIYTSGTTGKPKGTLVEHRGVINYASWRLNFYDCTEKDVTLQPLSFSFDGFGSNFYSSLSTGGSLCMIPSSRRLDFEYVKNCIGKYKVTNISLVPGMYKMILDISEKKDLESLRFVALGGEKIATHLVESSQKMNPKIQIFNEYGPTEATITAIALGEVNTGNTSFIGKPIYNTQVYLCTPSESLVPIGVVGEICLSGEGISRGYLNNPELTAAKFVENPYIQDKRIYKTGDMAIWNEEGKLELTGRIDDQVKIRGLRIEIGEIQKQILKDPRIKDAVVLTKIEHTTEGEEFLLCGFFVSDQDLDSHEILETLSKELPYYMLPTFIHQVKEIPFTANGKVDKDFLKNLEVQDEKKFIPPRNEKEEKLAEIWAEILGVERETIGIYSNFFELGGQSLKATLLISRIYKELNVNIPLPEIFKTPTIKGLSDYIHQSSEEQYFTIEPTEEREYYELSSAQNRLYTLQQIDSDSVSYNITMPIVMPSNSDIHRLEKAFQQLVQRHESLRTIFIMKGDNIFQRVLREVDYKIEKIDVKLEGVTSEEEEKEIIQGFVQPFDLSVFPLMRTGYARINSERSLLIIDTHHIIADGVSHAVLDRDFHLYLEGKELSSLKLQYKDFVKWETTEEQQESIRKQEEFWLKEFEKPVPPLELPLDYPRSKVQDVEGSVVGFKVDEEETAALRGIVMEEGATLNMMFLALFNVLLSKIGNQQDIVMGTVSAGRTHMDLEQIIGNFVNTLALRNFPESEKTFEFFLREVKMRTLEAYENQDYQFETLVEKVSSHRDVSRHPIFDVGFGLQNFEEYQENSNMIEEPEIETLFENYSSKVDLSLSGMEIGKQVIFRFIFSLKLFKEDKIRRFVTYFKEIIQAVIKDRKVKLKDMTISLDLLSAQSEATEEDFTEFKF